LGRRLPPHVWATQRGNDEKTPQSSVDSLHKLLLQNVVRL
jgi:hypothetical protein